MKIYKQISFILKNLRYRALGQRLPHYSPSVGTNPMHSQIRGTFNCHQSNWSFDRTIESRTIEYLSYLLIPAIAFQTAICTPNRWTFGTKHDL